jgi:hypothetical protein
MPPSISTDSVQPHSAPFTAPLTWLRPLGDLRSLCRMMGLWLCRYSRVHMPCRTAPAATQHAQCSTAYPEQPELLLCIRTKSVYRITQLPVEHRTHLVTNRLGDLRSLCRMIGLWLCRYSRAHMPCKTAQHPHNSRSFALLGVRPYSPLVRHGFRTSIPFSCLYDCNSTMTTAPLTWSRTG